MTAEIEGIKTAKEIRAHFATEYSSSPRKLSAWDFRRLKKADYCCEQCGDSIFELDDFPDINADGVYCEDCHRELYYDTCHVCQEDYEKPKKPTDRYFVVSKESEGEAGVRAGFYQVTKYPYFLAAVAFGFECLFEDSIKLLKACDINSMLRKIDGNNYDKVNANECCESCAKKYSGITPLVNNYSNKRRGAKLIKEHSKIIADGC